MNDRCPGCERPVATDASVCPCTPDDPGCAVCNALCWSSMHGYATCPWAIDWRARCQAAERIARDALDLAGEIHAAIVNGEAKYRAEWDYREDRLREELDGGKP